jgi:T5SS/PEP-CTERM-associated repeat protein
MKTKPVSLFLFRHSVTAILTAMMAYPWTAQAETFTWKCSNSFWDVSTCWNPNGTPTSLDTVNVFTVGGVDTLLTVGIMGTTANSASLYIDGSNDASATLKLSGGALEVQNALTIGSLGHLVFDGGTIRTGSLSAPAGGFTPSGALDWKAGTFVFRNDLSLQPGTPLFNVPNQVQVIATASPPYINQIEHWDWVRLDNGRNLTVNGELAVARGVLVDLAGGILEVERLNLNHELFTDYGVGGQPNLWWNSGTLRFLNGLTLGSGGEFSGHSTLTLDSPGGIQILDVNGTLTVANGGILDLKRGIIQANAIDLTGAADFNYTGGSIIVDGGAFNFGSNTGILLGGQLTIGDEFAGNVALRNGATLNLPNNHIQVAADGSSGGLTINSGSVVTTFSGSVADVFLNGKPTGTVNIDGAGSAWIMSKALRIGASSNAGLAGGTANVFVTDGARIQSQSGNIGNALGNSDVNMEVKGVNANGDRSKWVMNGDLNIGNPSLTSTAFGGDRILTIGSGALVSNVTANVSGSGQTLVQISGQNTRWDSSGNINLGLSGGGQLDVYIGSTVTQQRAYASGGQTLLGNGSSGMGVLNVSGGSYIGSGKMVVGRAGGGQLNISHGGIVQSSESEIAALSGAFGSVNVSGNDSRWDINRSLHIGGTQFGDGGSGSLTIGQGGTVDVNHMLQLHFNRDAGPVGGSLTLNGGTLRVGSMGAAPMDTFFNQPVHSLFTWNSGSFIVDNSDFSLGTLGSLKTVNLDPTRNFTVFKTLSLDTGGTLTLGDDVSRLDDHGNVKLTVGKLSNNGGSLDWKEGIIELTDTLELQISNNGGSLAPFGNTLTLNGNRFQSGTLYGAQTLKVSGSVQLFSPHNPQLTMDGGTLDAFSLHGRGLNWISGTITLHANDVLVESGAIFDDEVIGAGKHLNVNNLRIGPNADITINGGSIHTTAVFLDRGSLAGVGTLQGDVNNGGLVNPGNSPGTLIIDGDYTQTLDGALKIELGGLLAGSEYDVLNVSGTASLGGSLNVSLIDLGSGLFAPHAGDSFDILTADLLQGSFGTLSYAALLDPNLKWHISYLTDAIGATDVVRLSVVNAVPVPPAVWLFGSGLLGLAGVARRRRMERSPASRASKT